MYLTFSNTFSGCANYPRWKMAFESFTAFAIINCWISHSLMLTTLIAILLTFFFMGKGKWNNNYQNLMDVVFDCNIVDKRISLNYYQSQRLRQTRSKISFEDDPSKCGLLFDSSYNLYHLLSGQ